MPSRRDRKPAWLGAAGIGLEFAAAIAGFTLIGYWIDRHYGSSPKGLLSGLVLGMIGGGYNLIRSSLTAARKADQQDHEDQEKPDGR